MSIDVMKQALDFVRFYNPEEPTDLVIRANLYKALRERLTQPEQEPVAWGMRDMNGNIYDCISVQEHARIEGDYNVPLYTAPPHQEWVGLTDEEIAVICGECAASAHRADDISYARAIEAKLKEKNQ